jgi:uncharacterized membrane protein
MSDKAAASTSHGGFFISALVDEAWSIFKKSWMTLLGFFVLYMVLTMAPGMIASSIFERNSGMGGLLQLLIIIWNIIVGMGWMNVMLKVSRGNAPELNDFWEKAPDIIKYVLGVILYFLIVCGGLILLIIPGVIWSIKYMFIPFLIIDKGMGPMEAMRTSAKMTDGIKWDLVGAGMVLALVAYSGILALFVGLLVTVPVASIGGYLVYHRALKRIE